jgi:mannitol/fructose-specific phosphotransferase system IIA component (Ntr-type)
MTSVGSGKRESVVLECVALPLDARTPEEAIRSLAGLLSEKLGIEAESLTAELLAREAESPTYFGRGVAIPHARTRLAPRLAIAAGVCRQPVPWKDGGSPVRLVFLLAVPPSAIEEYLGVMKILAHLFRKTDAAEKLVEAPDAAAFLAEFTEAADKAAK